MNKLLISEAYQFYNKLPRTFFYSNNIMPSHYGGGGSSMMPKKMSRMAMSKLTDKEYYAEHSKHHSPKHIKMMKELQKMGLDRMKAHDFVKKHFGK